MPPGGGASRTWLRAAFALDGKASSNSALSSGLPPAFLCPSVRIAGVGGSQSLPAASRAVSTAKPPVLHVQTITRQPWHSCRGIQKRCFTNASASAAAPQEEESASATPFQGQAGQFDPQTGSSAAGPEELELPEVPFVEAREDSAPPMEPKKTRRLPLQCPGCGAFSQTVSPDEPGYFDLKRYSTMEYLGLREPKKSYPDRVRQDDMVVQEAMRRLELETGSQSTVLQELGIFLRPEAKATDDASSKGAKEEKIKTEKEPEIICVRCHELVHHHSGKPIFHPGIDAIRETIAESPYKYNHVYHVLDAADFPMSLLPRINDLLDAMPLRSRNRRARHSKFYSGRKTELSFVITRADLLAPRKEQVDRLMPWIRETLRQALGRNGRDVRLGNIRCVSARRNWWTSELREEIYKNGGANWLVGKANVGKSYLVHHVFPKGRMDDAHKNKKSIVVKNAPTMLHMSKSRSGSYGLHPVQEALGWEGESDHYDAQSDAHRANILADDGLLPPKPVETNYPQMPVVSNLPGTTASPIRIPFGGGKGELIDLPGLERTALPDHLQDEHQDSLVMKLRVQPDQVVLKGTWHSLLIGGFIRITPRTPDLVFMTYNFTPLREHRTGTEKAIAIQQQTSELKVDNIAAAGTGQKIKLAGSFQLKYDVTKQRAGPITRKDAVNISVDRLPYRVLAIDLLIEGCGWVEIVAQVRTRHLYNEDARRDAETERELAERDARANQAGPNGVLQSLDLSDPAEAESLETALDAKQEDDSFDPFSALVDVDSKMPTPSRGSIQEAPKAAPTAPARNDNAIQPMPWEEPEEPEPNWPVIDVFSPGGKFIGSRQPMNAWLMVQHKAAARKKALKSRPRKSMKGAKKREKAARREARHQGT